MRLLRTLSSPQGSLCCYIVVGGCHRGSLGSRDGAGAKALAEELVTWKLWWWPTLENANLCISS